MVGIVFVFLEEEVYGEGRIYKMRCFEGEIFNGCFNDVIF